MAELFFLCLVLLLLLTLLTCLIPSPWFLILVLLMTFRDADAVALLSCTDSCSTRFRLIEVLGLVVAFSAHVLGLQETRHPEGGICIGLRPLLPPPVTLCIGLLLFQVRQCGAVLVVVCAIMLCVFCVGPWHALADSVASSSWYIVAEWSCLVALWAPEADRHSVNG